MRKEISLNGQWHVRSEEGQYEFDHQVPGSVFQTLEEQGLYGEKDVFYRDNNRMCLEIADRDFLFSRTFSVTGMSFRRTGSSWKRTAWTPLR